MRGAWDRAEGKPFFLHDLKSTGNLVVMGPTLSKGQLSLTIAIHVARWIMMMDVGQAAKAKRDEETLAEIEWTSSKAGVGYRSKRRHNGAQTATGETENGRFGIEPSELATRPEAFLTIGARSSSS